MPFESHTGTDEHEVGQDHRALERNRDLHRQRHRLSTLEAGPAWSRFQLQTVSLLRDGHVAWVTTTEPNAETLPEVPRPNFGGGVMVYNVIDSRQAYPQEIVARGVAAVVPEFGEERASTLVTRWSRFRRRLAKSWVLS